MISFSSIQAFSMCKHTHTHLHTPFSFLAWRILYSPLQFFTQIFDKATQSFSHYIFNFLFWKNLNLQNVVKYYSVTIYLSSNSSNINI